MGLAWWEALPLRTGRVLAGAGRCGIANLRASGRPLPGGCWHCLTMSLICCVGWGKCSELSVEYRTSSGEGQATVGKQAGGGQGQALGTPPYCSPVPGSMRTGGDTHWTLEKLDPA